MRPTKHYPITICWSDKDNAFEARVPALRGCIAYGDTPEAAAKEVTFAADAWLEAAAKHGKPLPCLPISESPLHADTGKP